MWYRKSMEPLRFPNMLMNRWVQFFLFIFLQFFSLAIPLNNPSNRVCNVLQFGSAGDGQIYDTAAIQSAIDSCAKTGGSVYFPAGSYLTATIFLRSNVTLHLHPDATIFGGTKQEDYPADGQNRWYVILAEDAENVGITGGSINGQGLKFVVQFNIRKNVMVSWNSTDSCLGDECRPRLIGFLRCKNVKIWNVRLVEPAYWCLHIVNSDVTHIHDVSIYGDFNTPNNDGIDIQSSNNTVIERCRIDTGDDAICPKTDGAPLFNLSVTDCWIRTKSCAVKLGSATDHDFSRLRFDNLTIVNSHRGLGLQLRDSGNIRDIIFSNIRMSTQYYDPSWWGRAEPIYITACPRDPSTQVGSIDNISFVNITSTSENGIFLAGSAQGALTNIFLKNVSVVLKRFTSDPGNLHDYRPGCQELVPHRTSGIFMSYITSITMDSVKLQWTANHSVENWDLPLDFNPQTVESLNLVGFESRTLDEQTLSNH